MSQALVWAGGEHAFHLGLGELRALQQRCDAGPAWVLTRLRGGHWQVDDVVQPIRFGLIGAGMPEPEARALVDAHVVVPLGRFVLLAIAILAPAIVGEPDDPVGEAEGEGKTTPTRSPAANGASPASTPRAP